MRRRRDATVTILATCALTFGFVWFDIPGHAGAFISQDALLTRSFMDGHSLYLLGMFIVVVLESIRPQLFNRHPFPVLILCLTLGTAALIIYCMPVPLLVCAIAVVLMGFTDVMFINIVATAILIRACQRETQLAVIAVSLAAKTLIVYFSDTFLSTSDQIMLLITLPVLGVSSALAAWRLISIKPDTEEDFHVKFEKPLSNVMLGMLLISSLIFATTRVVSNMGFWGTGYALSEWGPIGAMGISLLYLAVCYITLIRVDSRLLFRFLPALFLLFVLYAFLYTDLGTNLGLSDATMGVISQYAELYGQTFAWAVILLAIRTLKMPAPRVIGIQFSVFTIVELFMQRCVIESSTASSLIVLLSFLAAFILLFWAQYHFYGREGLDQEIRSSQATISDGIRRDTVDGSDSQKTDSENRFMQGYERPTDQDTRVALASKYGLSQRETDVFLLLAQGRSRRFICDELFIADGTASSYIGRVYEKFGVHSKQELLSKVIRESSMVPAPETTDRAVSS